MGPTTTADPPATDQDPVAALTRLLSRAVRALGQAGHPGDASRLAADGWVALRHARPAEAERLNGVMHYLARLPDDRQNDTPKETDMTAEDRPLDVRSEAPARRHTLIFETWTSLSPGEGFVLINDHDPKPLYYQFAAEHEGAFTWDYLEEGPETWRVRIGRTAAA
ncbi:DUF2249 domain-containing protein [Actinomadura formosensis]|uniref:DUF2249 domain-containing protein n=1 Tax=Actinomadura formosensis TaxID=60706 RepID=UPI001A955EAB|nr:DUF2249 domain-containing protein [Actinomadura formosensis]